MINKLRSVFGQIKDPRCNVTKLHKLDDILLIGIMAVISEAQTWNEIEDYGVAKRKIPERIS